MSFCLLFDSLCDGDDFDEAGGSLVTGFGALFKVDALGDVFTQSILFVTEASTSEVLPPKFCGRAVREFSSFEFGDIDESLAST